MDEAAIERAGAAPLKPALNEIASLKSLKDLAQFLSREHLQVQGNGMMFGFGSNQDFADSSRVIAFAFAGGLGLPDRDYYTRTDPKSVEIRARYVKHVRDMFQLAGDNAKIAEAEAAI